MKKIEYINDLFGISKYKSFTETSLLHENQFKTLIETDKFLEVLKKHNIIKKDTTIISKEESSYNEITDTINIIGQYQIDHYTKFFITWNAVDVNIDNIQMRLTSEILFNFEDNNKTIVNEIILSVIQNRFIETEEESTFYSLEVNNNSFELIPEKIESSIKSLELNYGINFIKVHENILKLLSQTDSGIILLDGASGSGKSSYLKHLISIVSLSKNIIHIPRHLLHEMANSNFISYLREQRESIIILEDADDILCNREDGLNNIITTNILSLTNGILNDQLKIQIILSFNTERKYIDKKLLKSAKIIEEWSFNKLTKEQANLLAVDLGIEPIYKESVLLNDIYEEYEFSIEKTVKKKTKYNKSNKNRVGFKDISE